MKKLLTALILAFAVDVSAQTCYPSALDLIPFSKESLTVPVTVVALTASVYAPNDGPRAVAALITVGAQPVRIWFDASLPTSTVGHFFAANTIINVCQVSIQNLRAIRDTTATADAVFSVTYSRPPQ